MTPETARVLLHAYIDGELDVASTVELESHLSASPPLRQELARLSALQSAVQSRATRYACPPHLNARLFIPSPAPAVEATRPGVSPWWRNLAIGATAAALALVVWSVGSNFMFRGTDRALLEQVVSSHIRSLMANHLTDLASAERHSVKPWLSNRLDFAPPVHDLTPDGFLLVGGRLDYLGGKPTAAVVYRYRQHIINVFIWPASSPGDSSIRLFNHRGYNSASFASSGMNHWAVSDLNPQDLRKLATLLQSPPATK
jgi:anti-sigma factor RsiW